MLEARAVRWRRGQAADLTVANTRAIAHIVIDRGGVEHLLLRTASMRATLNLTGARAYSGPVRLTFIVAGRKRARGHGALLAQFDDLVTAAPQHRQRSATRIALRNALIALDGDMAAATHFQIAAVTFGLARARQAWTSGSRSMKELVRRARARGRELRDGGYRELIR